MTDLSKIVYSVKDIVDFGKRCKIMAYVIYHVDDILYIITDKKITNSIKTLISCGLADYIYLFECDYNSLRQYIKINTLLIESNINNTLSIIEIKNNDLIKENLLKMHKYIGNHICACNTIRIFYVTDLNYLTHKEIDIEETLYNTMYIEFQFKK